jgi:photosystem II stability/assembly factor-like uncharacterized protein
MKITILLKYALIPAMLLAMSVAVHAQWHSAPAFRDQVCGVIADSSGSRIWTVGHDGGSFPWLPTGRIWSTTDNGLRWRETSRDSLHAYQGYDSRIYLNSPIDPAGDTLVVRVYNSGSSNYSRSTNYGETWSAIVRPNRVSYIILSPWDRNLWLGQVSGGAIYRSTNAGLTWDSLTVPPSGIYSISFDPYRDSTLFGITSGRQGLYESDDNGLHWRVLFNNLTALPGVTPIANKVTPLSGGTLILMCTWDSMYHLAISEDRGQHWSELITPLDFQLLSTSVVVDDPSVPGTLYLSGYGQGGLLRSLDYGRNWYPVYGGVPEAQDSARVLYRQPFSGHLYLALRNHGLFRSTDHGAHWLPVVTPSSDNIRTCSFSFFESGISYSDQQKPDSEWIMQPPSTGWQSVAPCPSDTARIYADDYISPILHSSGDSLFRFMGLQSQDYYYSQIGRAVSVNEGQRWDKTFFPENDYRISKFGRVSNSESFKLYGFSDSWSSGTDTLWISDDYGRSWSRLASVWFGDYISDVIEGDTALYISDDMFLWTIQHSGDSARIISGDWNFPALPLVVGREVYVMNSRFWLQWNGADWDTLSTLPDGMSVQYPAVWIPGQQRIILPDFASNPPRLFSSLDRGRTWQQLPVTFPDFVQNTAPGKLFYDPYRALLWVSTANGPCYLDVSELSGMNITAHFKPADFTVLAAYPNPFNGSTRIRYDLDRQSKVQLQIYDLQGRLVKTLLDDISEPGQHELLWNADNLSSGTYFVRLHTPQSTRTQKLLLLK